MAKRRNPRGSQLVRGFLLGMAYAKGHVLTTARIRKIGTSKATAKRDMKVIRDLVPSFSSQPLSGMQYHVAQKTKTSPMWHEGTQEHFDRFVAGDR